MARKITRDLRRGLAHFNKKFPIHYIVAVLHVFEVKNYCMIFNKYLCYHATLASFLSVVWTLKVVSQLFTIIIYFAYFPLYDNVDTCMIWAENQRRKVGLFMSEGNLLKKLIKTTYFIISMLRNSIETSYITIAKLQVIKTKYGRFV